MLLSVFRCSRQLMIVSLSVHLSLQIGSFDFQRTQVCTEKCPTIVERARLEDEIATKRALRVDAEAERQESKRVEDDKTEKKKACIAKWDEVL